MPIESVIIPTMFFLMIFGITAAIVYGGVEAKRHTNATLQKAIDAGHQLDPETVASLLRKPARDPERDIAGGVTLAFLALGFFVAGVIANGAIPGLKGWEDEWGTSFFVFGAIIGAIGAGQLVAGLMRRDRKGK